MFWAQFISRAVWDRRCLGVLWALLLVFLSGCETTTMRPPQVDTVRFTPMAPEKRVLSEP